MIMEIPKTKFDSYLNIYFHKIINTYKNNGLKCNIFKLNAFLLHSYIPPISSGTENPPLEIKTN